METFTVTTLALAAAAAAFAPRAVRRLELSLAKHRSLTGHSRLAKRVAALVPGYAYDEARFFMWPAIAQLGDEGVRRSLDRKSVV